MEKIALCRKPGNCLKLFILTLFFFFMLTGWKPVDSDKIPTDSDNKIIDLTFRLISPGPAYAGSGIEVNCKNLPLQKTVTLTPSDGGSGNPSGYIWFGPFGMIQDQVSPNVNVPEGIYNIDIFYDDGTTITQKDHFEYYVGNCFSISASASRGKVKLAWPKVENTDRYDIYRADQNSPGSFSIIEQSTASNKTITYVDGTVQNDTAYLYVVGSYSGGTASFSNVVPALPTTLKSNQIPNYAPLIYSPPVNRATVGVGYEYNIKIIDPHGSAGLTLTLAEAPQGMTIPSNKPRQINWTPDQAGVYPVTINVSDGMGGNTTQSFNIQVEKLTLPISVDITADPVSVAPGETTTLSWSSPYATSVNVDNGIGTRYPDSSIDVIVNETTTYTITANGLGNSATDSVTVYAAAPPDISFQATPQNIPSGGTSYLTWTSANADTVSIDQGIGSVALISTGQGIPVSPTDTTIYTVTATGPGGTATRQVTVTVVPQPTISFNADLTAIVPGGASILSWTTTDADTVSINQNIGAVAKNGSTTVTPLSTTTYTITATGTGGTTTAQTTVTVVSLPAVNISADPLSILSGESSMLSWTSTNANAVSLDNGISSVALNGSFSVTPSVTTTYTITAINQVGTATAQANITVIPPPTISFSASPQSILSGESSTLTWSSTNANTVSIDNGIGDVVPNDSLPVTPSATTTYTITATGSGGTKTAQATVAVTPPPAFNFSAEPQYIMIGESSTLTWNTANADTVAIDQGVGTVSTEGSTTVFPVETTTYTITATGPAGTSAQTVIVDVSQIHLTISSPAANSIVGRPDVMVQGTLNNSAAEETGVIVNGVVAIIDGNQFTANHVPLDPGENTITVIATDLTGNTSALSQTVTCEVPQKYITIGADYESGVIPLDTIINISASFEFSTSNILFSGPANVEFISSTNDQYAIRITTSGVYYFTAEVTDSQSTVHSDTMAIEALDPSALNALLSAKWNGMKTSLSGSDVNGALGYISQEAKSMFQYNFNLLIDHLPEMAAGLNDISLSKIKNGKAEYNVLADQDGTTYSFYVLFVKDQDGIWRIRFF